MTNPLKHKHLLRVTAWCVVAFAGACRAQNPDQPPAPKPTAPLPTAGLSGQRVSLMPLTLIAAEDTLRWDVLVGERRASLDKADSVMAVLLAARAPEVTWVGPAELRRTARRAAGLVADPDQMGTSFLRAEQLVDVPDPLRHQLRTLAGLVGGRFVLVPAGLVYRAGDSAGAATAELSVVLVDTRLGRVGFRTVARGAGEDPWTALTRAMKNLTPGLP